ncbi:helix-turn-helix transcriptional regulator [Agrobacterium cavarae]|uniref:helix-turn-helix transcriptional regulator n=1 Tax=Agrobacterium cavarae TaxID=2528239 RepID=UPI00289D3673|nr:helix-turn-helix transcriptional regulator [Agrobacterium cavarae]
MSNVLKELRLSTKQSQVSFAAIMGVPTRTYEDLEAGKAKVRQVHVNAALWAVMVFFSDPACDISFDELHPKVKFGVEKIIHKLRLPPA